MAEKTYKVAVHGLMKKNGQMAGFGDELTEGVHIDDVDKKIKEGYILPADEFDAARKKEVDEAKVAAMTPEEKAKIVADAKKAKDDSEKHNDLLAKYSKQFNADAPDIATDEQIEEAIKSKKPIPVA